MVVAIVARCEIGQGPRLEMHGRDRAEHYPPRRCTLHLAQCCLPRFGQGPVQSSRKSVSITQKAINKTTSMFAYTGLITSGIPYTFIASDNQKATKTLKGTIKYSADIILAAPISSTLGDSVILTATVLSSSSNADTVPTGTVIFKEGDDILGAGSESIELLLFRAGFDCGILVVFTVYCSAVVWRAIAIRKNVGGRRTL